MSDPPADSETHVARRVFDWSVKWGGYTAAALSLVWSALLLVAAKDDLRLVAWVERTVEVYPARTTWQGALPLKFRDTSARDVRVVQLRVENYGRGSIGTQDKTWQVAVKAPGSDHASVLGGLKVSPRATVVRQMPSGRPNEVLLELGLLQPRAAVSFDLLLINTKDPYRPLRLDASLAGLPRELSVLPPSEHLFRRLSLPVILSVVLLTWVFFGPGPGGIYAEARHAGPPLAWALAWRIAVVSAVAAIIGGIAATGLAKVVAKFL